MNTSVFDKHKKAALEILAESLDSMRPDHLLHKQLVFEDGEIQIDNKTIAIPKDSRIWVFGSGKAAPTMAKAMEEIFGDSIHDGIIICPYGSKTDLEFIQQFEASHPVPDESSFTATLELLKTTENICENDIVFYLMSGGSSSLLFQQVDELELIEIQQTYKMLLDSGMNIHEMNLIRKHLSAVKGGQLRKYFSGAFLIQILISDVPGDNPADIGSGPLTKQDCNFSDAWQVVEKYSLQTKLPYHVSKYLSTRARLELKLDDSAESLTQINSMPGTAENLAKLAGKYAEKLGYNVLVAEKSYSGEAKEISKQIAGSAISILSRNDPIEKPAVLIHYGESTVQVKGNGKGGRNQELALAAAMSIEGQHYITLLSVGTDGKDGQTDAAGAICNSNTALMARKRNLEPEAFLMNNDSYTFFKQMDSLISSWLSGNNLMDLQITIIDS